MTIQEAINYLLDPLSLPESMDIKDKLKWHEDALNMAIEAMKAQELPSAQPEKRTEERTETHACDLISRHGAIDARRYTFGSDEFNLEDAYHDCKLVFDGITDDDSFQEADTGLILYYANEIIYALQKALEGKDTNGRGEQPEPEKYEYHYDHTDCIWYRPEARNRCPVTCAQYRDGWNDAMNYIFRDGKGYMPYRRDKQYGE